MNWPIIGIGSSAGGIEALSSFVKEIKNADDFTFVVIQHLSPHYRSMLVQLLGRDTSITVKEIQHQEKVQPGVLFVAPAAHNVIIQDGQFLLQEPSKKIKPTPSVDVFLNSLAEEIGEKAIAVILSGTGRDGAAGVRAVKAAGGIALVQSLEDAKYDGMPDAALKTGVCDLELPASKMAEHIEMLNHFPSFNEKQPLEESSEPEQLSELLNHVRKVTGFEFKGYKTKSLSRRIHRRMAVTKTESFAGYLDYLQNDPGEADKLLKEMLISVTAFFRDKEPFEAVAELIDQAIQEKSSGDSFRAWVAGCATGEEAYSIAILALEAVKKHKKTIQIQIYATDIDNNAIEVARQGSYPTSSLSELPDTLNEEYLIENSEGCQVSRQLRDCVVFARQDLVLDPPFMNMDLISCRNVLIYFDNDLQAQVLNMMQNSLKPEGILFLGRSENIIQQEKNFTTLHSRWRIFKLSGSSVIKKNVTGIKPLSGPRKPDFEKRPSFEDIFHKATLECFAPPSVLVNSGFEILHSSGDLGSFVTFPSGTPKLFLNVIICDEFKSDVHVLMHLAGSRQKTVKGRSKKIAGQKNRKAVRLSVAPVGQHMHDSLFLFSFERVAQSQKKFTDNEVESVDAETELKAAKEHLQILNEELETSNEEMQALTEELQAANEELQATNEELEASNEELQATNQELITLNFEMVERSKDLARLNAEYESVHDSVTFPLIVLDDTLSIKKVNKAASHILNLPHGARGQRLRGVELPNPFKDVYQLTEHVLQNKIYESRSLDNNGKYYELEVSPCYSADEEVTGVIVAIIDITKLRSAEQKAQKARRRMSDILNHSNFIFSLKDIQGRYQFVNTAFEKTFGVQSDDIIGMTDHEIFTSSLSTQFKKRDLEVLRMGGPVETEETLPLDIGVRHFKTVRFPLPEEEHSLLSICMQAEDITNRKHTDDQLRLAAKVFEGAGEGISITDAKGRIITVNKAFSKVTGYSAKEVRGKSPAVLKSGEHSQNFYKEMWQTIQNKGVWQGEIINRRKNGELYPEWLTINAVKDEDGKTTNFVGIFSDISMIKKSQKEIEYLATYDELTDLPNRNLFMDRLKHALARTRRDDKVLCVMFIDLDNFKKINDTMGHDVGDLLLQEAAVRLKKCVREEDTLARLGGDEFTILLENTDYEQSQKVAERIIDFLSASFKIAGNTHFVSASIGMSFYPVDGTNSQTLIKHADTAMYKAKELGKNQYCSFTSDMRVIAQKRLALETGLRQAIDEGSFDLALQPIVDIRTQEIVSAEALIRWNMPDFGPVPPDQFIPIAEQTGLVPKITTWVIEKVIAFHKNLHEKGIEEFIPISINLSAHDFIKGIVNAQLLRLVTESNLSAEHIVLELTETTLMENSENVVNILNDMRDKGFRISIDDFGTGYSSLSYLKKYPISTLKVDRSFIDGLGTEDDDSAISRAIIEMAHTLRMNVIAEGVETQKQADELIKLNCNFAQGYFFHKPMSLQDYQDLIQPKGTDDD